MTNCESMSVYKRSKSIGSKMKSNQTNNISIKKTGKLSETTSNLETQEPAGVFLSAQNYTEFKELGTSIFESIFANKIRTSETIENGLSYKEFRKIYDNAPFTEEFWADALGISLRSLYRYKQYKSKFKPLQTEKIIEMAEVISSGKKIFASNEKFNLWLETPNFVFEGKKPIELLKNSYGKELVIAELTQIDQGIFA